MDARVVRERNMSSDSEDDSDDMFTHERRDHHRRRSEPDVQIDNEDGGRVKRSKQNVTKKSRYANFSIMASDSESDHETDQDDELEPTSKSGHAHGKKSESPLLRAQRLQARAKSSEPTHSPTAPETGASIISPTARVLEGREEKGPEGPVDDRKVRRELTMSKGSGSPTGEKKPEGESETKRKRDKVHIEVTPTGVARKKSYREALEKPGKGKSKEGAKTKTPTEPEPEPEAKPEKKEKSESETKKRPSKKSSASDWKTHYNSIHDLDTLRLELNTCINSLMHVVSETGRKKAKRQIDAIIDRQTVIQIERAVKKPKISDQDSDLRESLSEMREHHAKSSAIVAAQAAQINTPTLAASLPPPVHTRERERERINLIIILNLGT